MSILELWSSGEAGQGEKFCMGLSPQNELSASIWGSLAGLLAVCRCVHVSEAEQCLPGYIRCWLTSEECCSSVVPCFSVSDTVQNKNKNQR